MKTKKCYKCGTEKSFDEFHRNKTNADGRNISCKECMNAYNRKIWAKKNHTDEEKKEAYKRTREWIEENRDRSREYFKNYQEKNREKLREYQKYYQREYRKKIKEKQNGSNKDMYEV